MNPGAAPVGFVGLLPLVLTFVFRVPAFQAVKTGISAGLEHGVGGIGDP